MDRDFLWEEWQKAARGERTGDCRWDGCSDCGACEEGPANDLAAADGGAPAVADGAAVVVDDVSVVAARLGTTPSASASDPRWRYVATFSVTGRGRFIGHLDRTEVFRRAVRKAGGRLALSAGMRPKALLSLALPLAVGVEGLREFCQFELAEEADSGFAARLAASLPAHMRLLALEPYEASRPLPARVVGATYEVRVSPSPSGPSGEELGRILTDAAARFADAAELPLEEAREGRVRRIDVKSYVDRVQVGDGPGSAHTLSFRAAISPTGTARPERVVEALAGLVGRAAGDREHRADRDTPDVKVGNP